MTRMKRTGYEADRQDPGGRRIGDRQHGPWLGCSSRRPLPPSRQRQLRRNWRAPVAASTYMPRLQACPVCSARSLTKHTPRPCTHFPLERSALSGAPDDQGELDHALLRVVHTSYAATLLMQRMGCISNVREVDCVELLAPDPAARLRGATTAHRTSRLRALHTDQLYGPTQLSRLSGCPEPRRDRARRLDAQSTAYDPDGIVTALCQALASHLDQPSRAQLYCLRAIHSSYPAKPVHPDR